MALKNDNNARLSRREAVGMDYLVDAFIKEMKLASGLNEQRIFAAWDAISGAAPYTTRKYLKNNILYCYISSSMLRQQLFFRREELVCEINEILKDDSLFSPDDPKISFIKGIVLQ